MKKNILNFAILLGLLFATSCSTEENGPKTVEETGQYKINVETTSKITMATYTIRDSVTNNIVAKEMKITDKTATVSTDFEDGFRTRIWIEVESASSGVEFEMLKDGQPYKDGSTILASNAKATYWDVDIN